MMHKLLLKRTRTSRRNPGPQRRAEPAATVLPDIESLGPDSDYSAFLGPDVDASLRRAALRKLFHSPKFNVLDGLDDYCDDFTQFAPLAGIVTADMRHHLERAARELARTDDGSPPRLPTGHDAKPPLPDDATDTSTAASVGNDDTVAASGATDGDGVGPATEESEPDADRRPA